MNRAIQSLSSSTLGVASKTNSPFIIIDGIGAGLPRAFENSLKRLAPARSLVTIFSQDSISENSGATDSTTRVMYTHGIQCSPSWKTSR